MSKYERVVEALRAVPEARREQIAAIVEDLFRSDLAPQRLLSAEQIEELRARSADPGPFASDEEVEAFFAELED